MEMGGGNLSAFLPALCGASNSHLSQSQTDSLDTQSGHKLDTFLHVFHFVKLCKKTGLRIPGG